MNRFVLLFLLPFILFWSPVRAQTQPPVEPAIRYQSIYEAEVKKLAEKRDVDLAALAQPYLTSLRNLAAKEQVAGHLDPLLAIREEISRFEKEKGVTEFHLLPGSAAVFSRQNAYLKRDQEIRFSHAKELRSVTDKYLAALEKLQADLVRQNQIAQAVSVKNIMDETRGRIEVKAASALLEGAGKTPENPSLSQAPATTKEETVPPEAEKNPLEDANGAKNAGNDYERIKILFERFTESILNGNNQAALQIVDPEQIKKTGALVISSYFNAFKPSNQLSKDREFRITLGELQIAKDGKSAQNRPWFVREGKWQKGSVIDWVNRNNEWYIFFKTNPIVVNANEEPSRLEQQRDRHDKRKRFPRY